jgi:hypothetical protein
MSMAIVRPAGASAIDRTSYLGLEVTLAGASLIGIDGLRFNAERTVSVNKATAANGAPATEKIDWAGASGSLLPDFSDGLTSGVDLRIAGAASLDIFGFVVGDGELQHGAGHDETLRPGTPDIGTGGTLTNAAVMGRHAREPEALRRHRCSAQRKQHAGAWRRHHRPRRGHRLQRERRQRRDGSRQAGHDQCGGQDRLHGPRDHRRRRVAHRHRRLTLRVSGTVLVNKATNSFGVAVTRARELGDRRTTPTACCRISRPIAEPHQQRRAGDRRRAAIDLFGFVVGSADFQFSSRTVDVDQNGNGVFSTVEKGSGRRHAAHDRSHRCRALRRRRREPRTDRTPVTDGAIGFLVEGGSLGLAIVRRMPRRSRATTAATSRPTAALGRAGFGRPAGRI